MADERWIGYLERDELPGLSGLCSPKVRETWGKVLGSARRMGCGEGSGLALEGRAAGEGEMGDHLRTSSSLSGVAVVCIMLGGPPRKVFCHVW